MALAPVGRVCGCYAFDTGGQHEPLRQNGINFQTIDFYK